MRWIRTLAYLAGVGVAGAYLLNPGAGVFELIPDTLPIVGHVDEAAMAALLFASLRRRGRLWWARPRQEDDGPRGGGVLRHGGNGWGRWCPGCDCSRAPGQGAR